MVVRSLAVLAIVIFRVAPRPRRPAGFVFRRARLGPSAAPHTQRRRQSEPFFNRRSFSQNKRSFSERLVLSSSPKPLSAATETAVDVDTNSAVEAIRGVVTRAATALRDAARLGDLQTGAEAFLRVASPESNAKDMSPAELADALEAHRAVYGPLLEWTTIDAVDVAVSGATATATTALSSNGGSPSRLEWTMSLDATSAQWLVDGVAVEPAAQTTPSDEEDDAGTVFTPSPSWVARTVLRALRDVDSPSANFGVDVALKFVSRDNPSSSVTRDIFRAYLDDANYPYGILTRWTEMQLEDPYFPEDVAEDGLSRCTVDASLVDDDDHARDEWTVSLELSKSPTRGWLIDRVWCEQL